ncbi:hypothetical protein B0H14DRAFT_3444609 [Mycena olivaceomarginata]|nr:hypothetical protein B0H14DRAFT_3444609 [Mycena olivaceomarginata]
MLHLLDSIPAHLPRLFSTTPSVLAPLPAPEDQSWYVNVWGVISCDRTQLYKDRVSACETPAQHPIYWAPPSTTLFNTYPAAGASKPPSASDLKIPSCSLSLTGILIYTAKNAWQHQGEKRSAVFVTMSWNDAWGRAQRWTTDYSEYLHAM